MAPIRTAEEWKRAEAALKDIIVRYELTPDEIEQILRSMQLRARVMRG